MRKETTFRIERHCGFDKCRRQRQRLLSGVLDVGSGAFGSFRKEVADEWRDETGRDSRCQSPTKLRRVSVFFGYSSL